MPLVIPEKKALVLRLQYPEKITALIPKYQIVEDEGIKFLAVPHNQDAWYILRNSGVNVTGFEPMRSYYKYPMLYGKYEPMTHQRETAVFCTSHKRCYVLNEMRTGKSAAVMWASDYLNKIKQVDRVLILSTMSCMDKVWKQTLFGLFPNKKVAILHGDRATRKKLLAMDFDYYIINHDGIKTISSDLRKMVESGKINLIVNDEGAEFRNSQTDKWKALKEIAKTCPRIWWLTGTPIPGGPEDAWAQARIVTPSTVPEHFGTWRTMTMLKVTEHKWVAKFDSNDRVFAALQPAVRYKKSDVLDVMPVTYEDREADLTPEQDKAYREIKKQGALREPGGNISAVNAAVMVGKMLQIASGAVKNDNGQLVYYPPIKRLKVMDEIIEQANAKVIVFAAHRAVVDLLVAHIGKYTTVTHIDGRVTGTARNTAINSFQEHEHPRVLVAHPKTTGHGLELSAADTIIWFSPIFSTDLYEQACHRIMSGMQKNTMGIYHIGCTALEWRIFRALKSGVDLQQNILKLYDEEMKERG